MKEEKVHLSEFRSAYVLGNSIVLEFSGGKKYSVKYPTSVYKALLLYCILATEKPPEGPGISAAAKLIDEALKKKRDRTMTFVTEKGQILTFDIDDTLARDLMWIYSFCSYFTLAKLNKAWSDDEKGILGIEVDMRFPSVIFGRLLKRVIALRSSIEGKEGEGFKISLLLAVVLDIEKGPDAEVFFIPWETFKTNEAKKAARYLISRLITLPEEAEDLLDRIWGKKMTEDLLREWKESAEKLVNEVIPKEEKELLEKYKQEIEKTFKTLESARKDLGIEKCEEGIWMISQEAKNPALLRFLIESFPGKEVRKNERVEGGKEGL